MKLIKKITFSFLLFGITTMNYADNFKIKHAYFEINHSFGIPEETWYEKTYVSNDNNVITDTLSDTFSISSDKFGIYKIPLTSELKKRMFEANKILRLPNIDKLLATNKKEKDFYYSLDKDTPNKKYGTIDGFEIYYPWNMNEYLKYGKKNHAKFSQQINDFVVDLGLLGRSDARVKFADFYGTTNIVPKKEGLEVILTLKNVGPFEVTISNPREWEAIPKVGDEINTDKTWYEIVFGGLYKDVSWTTRFGLESKYLIKDALQSDKVLNSPFIVKSNSERTLRFLVPYQDIQFRSNTGLIDGNRTNEGYVLLDYQAGVLDSSWIMSIYFGDVFSRHVWKEEKTATVKGWINLE